MEIRCHWIPSCQELSVIELQVSDNLQKQQILSNPLEASRSLRYHSASYLKSRVLFNCKSITSEDL